MRQLTKTTRRLCLGTFVLVAAPVVLASVASACTQLANLQANPNSGAAGATITVTGSRFRTAASDSPGPVEIRLDTRSSAPIATLPAASINPVGGTISMPVTIPAATSLGYHTLIATQHNTTSGALLSGFPVRATYNVTAAAAPRESTVAPAPAAIGTNPATTQAIDGSTPAAGVASTPQAPATAGSPTAPAGSAALTATVATPAGRASGASSAAPGSTDATPAPATPVATSDAVASAPTPAATVTETTALADSTRLAPATPAQIISSGLITSAADDSASVLPKLTLALGAAIVLLSLLAFVKSGRTLLGGRRPTNLV